MASSWFNILIAIDVAICIALIVLILLQQGKGADTGAGFGGGSSGSLFGATGSANFLSRTTAILATLFFTLSMVLTIIADKAPRSDSGSSIVVETNAASDNLPGSASTTANDTSAPKAASDNIPK